MSQLSRYSKTVVAVLMAAVAIGNQVAAKVLDLYGDHEWSSTDTIVTVSVLLSALLVYQVPNKAPQGAGSPLRRVGRRPSVIELLADEKQALALLASFDAALAPIITRGGGDATDVRNAAFHSRSLRNMVLTAAAGRESAARPVLDPITRGAEIQADGGGHRVTVRSGKIPGDDRTWWVVQCTQGDYTTRDLDQDVAVNLAEEHSRSTATIETRRRPE